MVDKPGRRKKQRRPWGKAAAVAVIALIVVTAGYYIYESYIYQAPPIYARMDTSDGEFYVELFPACAPQTVANLVSLADSGFYGNGTQSDALVWHRLVDTPSPFVIQTGDPHSRGGHNDTRSLWGQGFGNTTGLTAFDLSADHNVPLEVGRCPWIGNYEGYLGMARQQGDVNSGNTQFFINLSNSSSNLSLNGNYTVFGRVISGWSVVEAIAKSPICQSPTCPWSVADEPLPPVFLTDVVILGGTNPLVPSSSVTSSA
ncbi:MAG: peptidylprolyl isomerase [Nitrososphaerota archaeon]|nr:peptidylprolyl isomerase [Nitrososphaerota archaeon]